MRYSAKEALLAQEYELSAKRRDYACPNCGPGRLVGHVCRPKTQHVEPDRFLASRLVRRVAFTVDGVPADYRGLSRFNILICPRCYLLVEGPAQLLNGEVQVDKHVKSLYARTGGHLPVEEGDVLFADLFWARMHRNADQIAGADWYAAASSGRLIAARFVPTFRGKESTFNAMVDSLLLVDDRKERASMLHKIAPILDAGPAGLIAAEAYRSTGALHAYFEFRLAQYAVMIGRETQKPFRVDPGGEIVVEVARWLLDLLIARRPVPRATTGHALIWATRMGRFAPDPERLRWAHMVAWLASEHLIRKGQISYNDPSCNPDSIHDNNEALRYLNLVLRNELGLEDVTTKDTPGEIRSQLSYGLNRCCQFSKGNGTPLQRRAWRLGEQVAKLAVRNLPEGAVELINQAAS